MDLNPPNAEEGQQPTVRGAIVICINRDKSVHITILTLQPEEKHLRQSHSTLVGTNRARLYPVATLVGTSRARLYPES